MANDSVYLKTAPGILQLITCIIGLLAFAISVIANFSQYHATAAEFENENRGRQPLCSSNPLLQQIGIVILFFCTAISTVILIVSCLTQMKSTLKVVDICYHAVGSILLLVAGILLILHIDQAYYCLSRICQIFPDGSQVELCRSTQKHLIRYNEALTAGAFAIINFILFVVLSYALCICNPIPAEQQQTGMQNYAYPGAYPGTPGQPQPQYPGAYPGTPGQPQPQHPAGAYSGTPGQPQPQYPGAYSGTPGQPQSQYPTGYPVPPGQIAKPAEV